MTPRKKKSELQRNPENFKASFKDVVAFIYAHFPDLQLPRGGRLDEHHISWWYRGLRLPHPKAEAFPRVSEGVWNESNIKAWVEKWLVKKEHIQGDLPGVGGIDEDPKFALLQQQLIEARAEWEERKKSKDGKHITILEAERKIQGFAVTFWQHVVRAVEVDLLAWVGDCEKRNLSAKEIHEEAKVKFPETIDNLQKAFAAYAASRKKAMEIAPVEEPRDALASVMKELDAELSPA
jgi:hypothetical protein